MSDGLLPGEELVRLRIGAWRILLPMRFVERVLGAALPAAVPSSEGPPVVAVEDTLLPVLFGEALWGAEQVVLRAADQMLLLHHAGRRALLWVGAVEEVVEFTPVAPPGGANDRSLVAAYSGGALPLAVLDVPRLLERAG